MLHQNSIKMKKLVCIIFAVALFSCAAAQDHITFMGVPVDGTLDQFSKRATEKGLTYVQRVSDIDFFFGNYLGYDCVVGSVPLESQDLVYSVLACIFPFEDWQTLQKTYSDVKKKLTEEYGKPKEEEEKYLRSIRDETRRRMLTDNAKEILEDFTGDTYLYPTRYNDENAIVRYFDLHFLYGDELIAVEDWEQCADASPADASICVALPRSEEQIAELRGFFLNSSKAHGKRVLFMLPQAFSEIEETACAYRAIVSLMDKAAGALGSDEFWIIPSSIHEVLLIPSSVVTDRRDLDAMIHEVNTTQVPDEEILSDHAYQYIREMGRVVF